MIELRNISKTFATPHGPLVAVRSASLHVAAGDVYGIIGFSGAGKSTLLRTINLLEKPDPGSGPVMVNGRDMLTLSPAELRKARRSIGMIFQHFNLLNNLTVAENISFPLDIAGVPSPQRKLRVQECLEIVGLQDKARTYPAKLSGGQKQRVAIARALANHPTVLLCDEPTSSLDPKTTEDILAFLSEINRAFNITIVIVTHEMAVIKSVCNKVAVMDAGVIEERFSMDDRAFVPQTKIASFLFKENVVLVDEKELARV